MKRTFVIGTLGILCAYTAFAVKIGGSEYMTLKSCANKFALKQTVLADGKQIRLNNAKQNVSLTLNQRATYINGTQVWLNRPVTEIKDVLYISKMDYERTLVPLLNPNAFSLLRYNLRHIIIDAGHGGRDTGARNTKLKVNEKKLTLDVAERVKQRLEVLGYHVTLTRSEDQFIELKDRPRLANSLKADLFVSIHFNAAEDKSITGVETYTYTPQNAPSSSRDEVSATDKAYQPANAHDIANLWLAYEMQKSMVANLKTPDRGVRHARFVVLESLKCPGILVEGGFISSPTEGSRLSSTLYRQLLANSIVDGIRAYHRRIIEK